MVIKLVLLIPVVVCLRRNEHSFLLFDLCVLLFFVVTLWNKTNNYIIMTKHKSPTVDPLLIDVLEYAFTEWLVRRKIFAAFRSNYDRAPTPTKTFRDCLRAHIRYVLRRPSLRPESLISSAFLFHSAPEGYKFWMDHSEAWRRFYNEI